MCRLPDSTRNARIIGFIQCRLGPNRGRFFSVFASGVLGQPIADVVKLIFKEIIIPTGANKRLFVMAPVPGHGAFPGAGVGSDFRSVIHLVLADINAGLLYILALTSLAVYGIIVAGWASNSKYAFLGAMRSAAQIVSYEIAMGFALVCVLIAAGSLNSGSDYGRAKRQHPALVLGASLADFSGLLYFRGGGDQQGAVWTFAEGESELVAGFHVEYGGMAFSIFFMAEYANMVLIAVLTAVLFMGGWLSPFQGLPLVGDIPYISEPNIIWLLLKTSLFLFMFLWLRATFPPIPLRPDHASWLEGVSPHHHHLDCSCIRYGRCRGWPMVQLIKKIPGVRVKLVERSRVREIIGRVLL